MKVRLVSIIALTIILLAGCDVADVPKEQRERYQANTQALAGVQEGDVVVCERSKIHTIAFAVTRIRETSILDGTKIESGSAQSNSHIPMSALAAQCLDIHLITDKDDAAEIVGRILLGQPSRKHDLLVAPSGGIVAIRLFNESIAGFTAPACR
jgi:hypothetical protein